MLPILLQSLRAQCYHSAEDLFQISITSTVFPSSYRLKKYILFVPRQDFSCFILLFRIADALKPGHLIVFLQFFFPIYFIRVTTLCKFSLHVRGWNSACPRDATVQINREKKEKLKHKIIKQLSTTQQIKKPFPPGGQSSNPLMRQNVSSYFSRHSQIVLVPNPLLYGVLHKCFSS